MAIPDFFKKVFITAISKRKKSSLDLSAERGIFLVPKLRSLFNKLLYNSIINTIEDNLSSSNIGARKNKGSKDHLFVLYSVLNDVKNSKDPKKIDLVFMMWLKHLIL